MRSHRFLSAAAVAVGLLFAACSNGSSRHASPASSTSSTAEASTPTSAAAAAADTAKVSANTASQDEVAAALEAAGVPSAARWAREVVEYRPYPANDPTLQKLRGNLAKYNPGQDVEDKIISALKP